MFLLTLVLGVLFLPEADNLKCKCESISYGNCSKETTECPSQNDRCSVATLVTVVGDVKVSEHNYKDCIMPELCLDYSFNNGAFRVVQKRSCCSEDLCNAQINYTTPEYKSTPNGRKCFSCGEENCMKTLNCVGDETYCIKLTENALGQTHMMKGCASKSFCSDKSASRVNQFTSRVNQFASRVNQVTQVKISCCQGDLCNSASSTSPILLLLLVPLLFSALFS